MGDREEIWGLANMDGIVSKGFPSDQQSTDHHQLLQSFYVVPSCKPKKDEQNSTSTPSEDHQGNVVSSWLIDGGQDNQDNRIRKANFGVKDGKPSTHHDNKKKKIIHRDIERQRRQDMTTLYSTLRSLLPLEYIKGKRSMSDHMQEAVKYINYLQNKIKVLSDKRDELKRSLSSKPEITSPDCSAEDSVVVRACFVGMEVVINTGLRQGLPLSTVIDVIVAQGLSIVNCISSKVNERVLHTIVLEVMNDGRSIELSDLQQKLTKLIIDSRS